MPNDRQDPAQGATGPKKGTLAFIIGPIAAAALLAYVPAEESGRQVEATIAADGTATVRHVAGKQYLNAYLDIVGVATACDGITRGVRMGQRYTEAQCAALLERELIEHAEQVMRCTPRLKEPGRDFQRVAAISLAYNIGWPRYCKSTVDRRFDAGNLRGGCQAFLMWNKAGGREVAGLTARRKRERDRYCLRGL